MKACECSRCGANARQSHGERDRLLIICTAERLVTGTHERLHGKSKYVDCRLHVILTLPSASQHAIRRTILQESPTTPRGSL
jgi:hypothetical protein